ncbi:S1 family peptidase [Umezawaea tangerina]|uniref:Alpha-lytic protease prodomain-containing protein n=1 Tax=Umezawaea tangerina TaxID=84725 RepID=A0A2T0SZD3_9PSEU|nr:S1 family peptidase [Umezawaea tangerina]PRY38775.1 alpha-lytic protease prodomain-containing protein [Umezawaea tangerina]
MRQRALTRLGLTALLAVGASVGLTPTTLAAPSVAPDMVAAMKQDLGLTDQQARTRLAHESVATKAAPKAEEAAGEAFAGTWYDADKGKLVVALTDSSKASAVRSTGAETTAATHTMAKLDSTRRQLDALSKAGSVPSGVSAWRVDPRTNSVVVDVQEGADVSAFLDKARAAGPVTVNTKDVKAPQTFAAGTVGGDPYYVGPYRCSIGFSVAGGYVTAGHCAAGDGVAYGWDRSYQGNFAGSSFPGNDYAFVRTGGGWWNVPVVLGWGTVSDALVRGSWEAPVGTSVCRSGSTTHWHCGVIQGRNETVNYAQGAVYEMVGTSVCAEGGDSGGSFITGDQAQGVTSGGYGNCSAGGRTWFQPVNEILRVYGLSLLTA